MSALVTAEGDYPQLPALLARTRARHDVREVSANKAYASINNHETLDHLSVAASPRTSRSRTTRSTTPKSRHTRDA
jgi:hypothetical protein